MFIYLLRKIITGGKIDIYLKFGGVQGMKYENLDHGFGSEDKEHMEYREKADTLTSTRPPCHRTKVRGGGLRRSNDAEIADFGYHRFISGSENSQKQVNFIGRRYIVGQRCAAFFRAPKNIWTRKIKKCEHT